MDIIKQAAVATGIVRIVSKVFKVSYGEILSPEQRPGIAIARYSLSILLLDEVGMSINEVAEVINRDRRSVNKSKAYVTKAAVKTPALGEKFTEAQRLVREHLEELKAIELEVAS
jgi:chromosomal replication initiation ATPase DnaA